MASFDGIEVEGRVMEALPNTMYRVGLANGHVVLAHVKGKARLEAVQLRPGDNVRLEMTPFDLSVGCIVSNKK
jgi:translation initiation factor IF-1